MREVRAEVKPPRAKGDVGSCLCPISSLFSQHQAFVFIHPHSHRSHPPLVLSTTIGPVFHHCHQLSLSLFQTYLDELTLIPSPLQHLTTS